MECETWDPGVRCVLGPRCEVLSVMQRKMALNLRVVCVLAGCFCLLAMSSSNPRFPWLAVLQEWPPVYPCPLNVARWMIRGREDCCIGDCDYRNLLYL